MDFKVIFLITAIIVSAYRMEVNSESDEFAIVVCREFNFGRNELFRFLTMAKMVDKWIDWIPTFIEANHIPFGVGKMFKAFYYDNVAITVLKVTGYSEGHYLAVESNFRFSPRIELYFLENEDSCLLNHMNRSSSGLDVRNSYNCSKCEYKTPGSELRVRLTINSNSALFQHTVGVSLHAFLRREVTRLLYNFEAVFENHQRWQRYFKMHPFRGPRQ